MNINHTTLEEYQLEAKKRNDIELNNLCNKIMLICGWSLAFCICFYIIIIIIIHEIDYFKN